MAKKEKKVEESKVEETKVKKTENKTKDNITKVKIEKPKETITKVNIDKPPMNDGEVKEKPVEEEVVVVNEEPKVEKEEAVEQQEETPVVQEITEEDIKEVQEEVEETVIEAEATGEPLPEKIQKLVDFMDETGGDLNDYVNLNRDISKMDDSEVLDEYYRTTKSHLTPEERNFLLEDSFGYDEEIDDTKDIRKKKIALKEQVAEARAHLDGQKSKYYEDIKAGSKLTQEQQKAVDFFNRYNKESEATQKTVKKNSDIFTQKTNNVFNDKFKGFEYNVGDKKYRFNVNNAEEVKNTQSDISNFTKKFLDKNSALTDAKGYHKSLYTAMNADAVAKHFYEQGKADAMKDSVAKAKNVNMDPRQAHGTIEAGGMKFKVLGDDSSDLKFKIKQK